MENAILLHNKHWENTPFDIKIKRKLLENLLKFHQTKEIQVITGIRRSGKSSLLKLYINELLKTEIATSILFINFDDPSFFEVYKNPEKIYTIIEIAEKLTQTQIKYLFLDEIQVVHGWEKFIKSVYDAERFNKICITGSNSKLLNSHYATLLSGRYIKHQIFPLSIAEIFRHHNLNTKLKVSQNKAFALNLLETIVKYGSFPEIIKQPDSYTKHEILINYFDSILIKDCIVNKNIRDNKSFKELAFYLFNNISALYSYNSLARAVNSNDISIKEYLNVMQDAFLIYEISQFSYKIKKILKSKRKIYTIDNGLITAVSLNFSENKGKLFENLVFSELLKNGYQNIFLYNDKKECDFIVKLSNNLIAFQAVYEINTTNREREIAGINYAMEQFEIAKAVIVSLGQSEIINDKISIIPIYQLGEFLSKV